MTNIFIGSGEASTLERKVLIFSLIKNANIDPSRIFVFNGTHDCLEDYRGGVIRKIDMDLDVKRLNITEFSLYRFMVPSLEKNKSNSAIFLDSDIVALSSLDELLKIDDDFYDVKCCTRNYPKLGTFVPATSVIKFNCNSKVFPSWEEIVGDLKSGLLNYADLQQFTRRFTERYPILIAELATRYNSFDYYQRDTALLHYTDLRRQPWRYSFHRYGDAWFRVLFDAVEAGFIDHDDIGRAIDRGNARPNIMRGNTCLLSDFLAYTRRIIRSIYD